MTSESGRAQTLPSNDSRTLLISNAYLGDTASMKRAVLFYDRVLALLSEDKVPADQQTAYAANFDLLLQQGIVTTTGIRMPINIGYADGTWWNDDPRRAAQLPVDMLPLFRLRDWYQQHGWSRSEASVFATAQLLEMTRGISATSAVVGPTPEVRRSTVEGDVAAKLILERVPMPDASVPWEQVFEIRADSDMTASRERLLRWMRRLVTEGRSRIEIHQELDELIEERKAALTRHRIAIWGGSVGLTFSTAAPVVAALVSGDPVSGALVGLPGTLVSFAAQMWGMSPESTLPGREVAFLMGLDSLKSS